MRELLKSLKQRRPLGRLVDRLGGPLHAKGLLIWGAALATGVLCIWEQAYATRLASEIEELQQRRARLKAEIGFLEMECISLSSRERIQQYASERLDMRYPKRGEVLHLGMGASPPARQQELVVGSSDAQTDG